MSTDIKIVPSILPGFMELLPREQLAFNSMLCTIQESFELFGFMPVDTPIIEKAEILLAKGGEETERQIYSLKKGDNNLALRFDLTVPLARYVSEHFDKLAFPFKRYQIGKVYRGEKPQKGRFREFYQCDIDIIGKGELDLVNDAEILAAIYFTFNKLELGKFIIRINNRKVLMGFAEAIGLKDNIAEVLRIIDKKDKMTTEEFADEFSKLGLTSEQIKQVTEFLGYKGSSEQVLNNLESSGIKNQTFLEGLQDLKEVCKCIKQLKIPEDNWQIDLTIARGLDYYTGTVYETNLVDYKELGSVCGGGRYDNLAEYFTDQKLPGVGISIGLTRLFYQLNEQNLINKDVATPAKLLLISLGDTSEIAFGIATDLRLAGIKTDVYTEIESNMRKKLDYANKIGVPYVGILGDDEIKSESITIKDMKTGEQKIVKWQDIAHSFNKNISQ